MTNDKPAPEIEYQDIDGNPVSLDKLCRIEPAWAANRIRSSAADYAALEAKFQRLVGDVAHALPDGLPCPECGDSGTVLYTCNEFDEADEIGPCQFCYECEQSVFNVQRRKYEALREAGE